MISRRQFLAAAAVLARQSSRAPGWRAGIDRADITPPPGLWMAGYAARTSPSTGTALPLNAKVLALECDGTRLVLVTLDLLGITAAMRRRIGAELARLQRLPSEALIVAASHTHCGPVVDDQLSVAYDLGTEQRRAIAAYTEQLEHTVVAAAARAIGSLEPVTLEWSQGRATFGANRRTAFLPPGPSDPAVPVLRVARRTGTPLALVFGYACHNTTLPATMTEFHGDYCGVAQRDLERRHPGTQAMFVAGCGADVNPSPRGTPALVEQHGMALADAVDAASSSMTMLDARVMAAHEQVALRFAPDIPDRAGWEVRRQSADVYVRRHAALMIEHLERDGRLEADHLEPLHVWRLGGMTLVAFGGEVVTDYALRLKREHASSHLWVAGYCDDVSCYIPSGRVLEEGGYEGGGAMLYYGRPGPFAPVVEERLFTAASRLLRKVEVSS